MSRCGWANGAGQDIHDYDTTRGRACSLCERRIDPEWQTLIAAEDRRIALAEGAPTPKGTHP